MNLKTFFGLLIALMSAFACVVFIDIIKTQEADELLICVLCSGAGIIGGLCYAVENSKLGERMADFWKDGE